MHDISTAVRMVLLVHSIHEQVPNVLLTVYMNAKLRALAYVCDIFLRRLVHRSQDPFDLMLGGGDKLLCGVGLKDRGDSIAVGTYGIFTFTRGVEAFVSR